MCSDTCISHHWAKSPYRHSPELLDSMALHITCLGKDQNSRFEVWFLLNAFHFRAIINSKHCKSNHHKVGDCLFQANTVAVPLLPPSSGNGRSQGKEAIVLVTLVCWVGFYPLLRLTLTLSRLRREKAFFLRCSEKQGNEIHPCSLIKEGC